MAPWKRTLPLLRVALLAASCAAGAAPLALAQPPVAAQPMAADEPSYALLENPTVAEQLGLTAPQRSQVEQLLANRKNSLAESPLAEHDDILAEYEEALRSILNQRQQGLWRNLWASRAPAPPKPAPAGEDKLQFSFRFQPWADVLNWFAERAKLSLVLDAPPPGTFNYTDNRAYTTAEAIDLLNGVLMTKGYTLIRRERMLMLLDLAHGIPEDLIPRVNPDELEARGKFEPVSVLIDIGKRKTEEVEAEIKPLLGPHGKVSQLPKTHQVLVSDTAGKLRTVREVIAAIPEPTKEQPATPRGEPEKPVLANYALGSVAPTAALEVLKALLPDAKAVHEPKTDQLVVWATPPQHAAVRATLDQMQGELPPEKQRTLERHALAGVDSTQLLTILKPQIPDAQLVVDTVQSRLVAFATVAQHATIRSMIEQLGGQPSGTSPVDALGPQLVVYPLTTIDMSATLSVLQPLVPAARLVLDPRSRSLVALASERDHATIRATIEQLSAAGSGENGLLLQVYHVAEPLRKRAAATVDAMIADLPGVKRVVDADSGDISVWAKPVQHEMVKQMLAQLEAEGTGVEPRTLVAYRLLVAEPSSVLVVLQTLLPDAKFVAETKTRHLVAWARPAEHEQIRTTLTQIDQDVPDEQRLKLMAHPLDKADASTALAMVRALLPTVQTVNDAKNNTLAAWAKAGEHETIKEAIARLQPDLRADKAPKLVVHPVNNADPVTMLSLLQPLAPLAKLTADRDSKSLAAWATPAEHELFAAALKDVEARAADPQGPQVVVYPAGKANPSVLATMLAPLIPLGRVTADAQSGQVAVWATARDHERVKQAIAQMQAGAAERETRTYRFTRGDANAAFAVLRATMPTVPMAVDSRTGSLVATADPAEHERIKATVAQLDQPVDEAEAPRLATYELHGVEPSHALTVLTTAYLTKPEVRLSLDPKSLRLVAWARPIDQQTISQLVAQLNEGGRGEERQVRAYPLKTADPSAALTVVRSLLPGVTITLDTNSGSLVANVGEGEHRKITAALAQLESSADQGQAATVQVYELRTADPKGVYSTLSTMLASRSGVRVSLDPSTQRIVAWAPPAQQDVIRQAIDAMDGAGAKGLAQRRLEVYALGEADTQTVVNVLDALRSEMPDARLIQDAKSGQLAALARAEEHEMIRAAIERLQTSAPEVQVFSLAEVDPRSAAMSIRNLFENDRSGNRPRVDSDVEQQRLIVRGTQQQLTDIRQLLLQMGETSLAVDNGSQRRLRVVSLPGAKAKAALAEIQRIWPQLRANPVRVVTPSAVAPLLRQSSPDREGPAENPPAKILETPAKSSEQKPGGGGGDDAAAADQSQPPAQVAPQELLNRPKLGLDQSPPIIVAPGRDSVTIASDDPEALDQFEKLLRTFSGQAARGGREFHVFTLKSAEATQVAQTIAKLFGQDLLRPSFFSSMSIVPDERLNAVIVKAGANDLATIESLLETLDAFDVPESLLANKTKRLSFEHARATEIESIIREVYQPQLTSGSSRKQFPIPSGLSREQSAVFEQLNAAASGPVMTLSVDEGTNSLIVVAPGPLLEEVEQLADSLDTPTRDARHTVRVLALEHISSEALDKAMKLIMREPTTRSRRSRSGSR